MKDDFRFMDLVCLWDGFSCSPKWLNIVDIRTTMEMRYFNGSLETVAERVGWVTVCDNIKALEATFFGKVGENDKGKVEKEWEIAARRIITDAKISMHRLEIPTDCWVPDPLIAVMVFGDNEYYIIPLSTANSYSRNRHSFHYNEVN